jgi:outer membrane protein
VNKSNVINGVLGIAVVVLYVLHFIGNKSQDDLVQDQKQEQELLVDEKPVLINDSSSVGFKEAVPSKVAYFNLESLVSSCSYLNLKTQALIEKEKRLYASFETKEKEFQQWYMTKQQELAEYEKKKMLVQSHLDQAQREGAEKQQMLQVQLEKEKQGLLEEKQRFSIERDNVIFEAMSELNKESAWDYVLVDNSELRLVIPFNQSNNVTENLANIINKRYAQ